MVEYHLRHGNICTMKSAENRAFTTYMERYRSGHNEAVLKTVCPQGRVGSNPTLSARRKQASECELKAKHELSARRFTNFSECEARDKLSEHTNWAIWRSTQAGRRGSPGKGVGR